ncbi:MAG: GNAT family N-acetyltransferase [Anaerolineales bacterium]|nr:GNAT family N-acetyltransferase [Anaerolineales bacterium]
MHEVQGFVDGRVQSRWRGRGIGGALLAWLEARAVEQLAKKAGERKRVLRIPYYDRSEDALALFKSAGYRFQFSEVEMRVQIRDRSRQVILPEGFHAEAWTPVKAHMFYRAHCEAFQTRTDHLSRKDRWSHHFTDYSDDEFSPSQSLLVTAEGEPAGYAEVHRYDCEDGEEGKEYWIAQIGVAPGYRRRGLARWILQQVMNAVHALGYAELTLTVNVNNPGAMQVDARMNFRAVKQ